MKTITKIRHSWKILLCFGLFIGFCSDAVFAQALDFTNKDLLKIAKPAGTPGWIKFREDLNLQPLDIFVKHKSAFELGEDGEMFLVRERVDDLGFSHYKFQQWYKGLKVEGAEFILHAQDGRVVNGNGRIVPKLEVDVLPQLSTKRAIEIAKSYMPAELYMWEDAKEESHLQAIKNNPLATYFPEPQLLITYDRFGDKATSSEYQLVYRIEMHTKLPYDSKAVYIDAQNGNVIFEIPLTINCTPGEGCTLFNGTRPIDTDPIGAAFRLFDDCRGDGIHTRRISGTEIMDADNVWDNPLLCPGVSAHWALGRTYDYFRDIHGLNSYDGNGTLINAFIESNGAGPDNAFWSPILQTLNFGAGAGAFSTDDWVSLDIVGHEFAHAVTEHSAGLEYIAESGALNESFSDIFGTAVEFFAQDGTGNYLVSEDIWIVDGYLRSLMDPKAKNQSLSASACPGGVFNFAQPDTYQGINWIPINLTGCDNGGVHINSGVQNFWFYLLAEGSAATDEINDNGDAFSVEMIGLENAAAIAFRNLTVYLTLNSTYADARAGSIQAATDIFGTCSFEVQQTIAAWDAVGLVGEPMCLCEENLIIDDVPIPSNEYEAEVSITSTGVVSSGSNVDMNAGEWICLNPNFSAEQGAEFFAYIEGCTNGFNAPVQSYSKSNQQTVYERAESTTTVNQNITVRNFPNPFSDVTTFEIEITKKTKVMLGVYDISGQLLMTLIDDEWLDAGMHLLHFNGESLTDGVYLYRLSTDENVITEKMILSR